MAKKTVSRNIEQWNDVLLDYRVAKAATEAVAIYPECWNRSFIYQLFEGAVRAVQHTPASTLSGIVEKLQVYWRAGDLADGSYGNNFRIQILGDLRRIERLQAGVEEPHASGGMDLDGIERKWNEMVSNFKRYSAELAKARAENVPSDDKVDLVALIDEAEEALLSMPSPNVGAVIQKLEILWQDGDWYGSIGDTSLHAGIMGELIKFAEDGDGLDLQDK